MKPKIVLVYIDSGGGHRAAATALREAIRERQCPWDVEMLSIQELLDPMDVLRKCTGIPSQDVYNIMLRRGWTLGTAQLVPLLHLLIRLSHDSQVRLLQRSWARSRPDLLVSLIPHLNRALKDGLERARPGTPFVTILTDLADYPPHFWIEPQDQYVICGSALGARQARALGIPQHRVLRTSGMILNPKFYVPLNLDRGAQRIRLGLAADRPTGLLLFGGQGSTEMLTIAKALNRSDSGIQLIALCGKNDSVASQLRQIEWRIPAFIEGFTPDVPLYMELADFFIGKPGPASISEALAKGLPVIVQQNAWTMAHERYNAQWIEEQGVGLVVRRFSTEIAAAVRTLLAPENYARFRARAAATRNFAVYEIPELLERILRASRRETVAGPLAGSLMDSTRASA